MKKSPIGIFDSGVGGLTVARAIWKELPGESLIYLGDTARVPYGTRGEEVICRFAIELAKFLLKRQVKALVVACNTISSTCLENIYALSSTPVVDAVNPAVEEAVKTTKTKVIGVIGTNATITSRIYEKKIKSLDPKIKILTATCPLFVPIAEEGLSEHPVAYRIAKDYLEFFTKTPIDTLILGCTHYPLLKGAISKNIRKGVKVIDSAQPTALALKELLQEKKLLSSSPSPSYEFLVTDAPQRVHQIAKRFFGGLLPERVKKISLDE